MLTDRHLPAPFLVCTYSFGESELPAVRPARSLGDATDIAKMEAAARCQPVVRVYSFDAGDCGDPRVIDIVRKHLKRHVHRCNRRKVLHSPCRCVCGAERVTLGACGAERPRGGGRWRMRRDRRFGQ